MAPPAGNAEQSGSTSAEHWITAASKQVNRVGEGAQRAVCSLWRQGLGSPELCKLTQEMVKEAMPRSSSSWTVDEDRGFSLAALAYCVKGHVCPLTKGGLGVCLHAKDCQPLLELNEDQKTMTRLNDVVLDDISQHACAASVLRCSGDRCFAGLKNASLSCHPNTLEWEKGKDGLRRQLDKYNGNAEKMRADILDVPAMQSTHSTALQWMANHACLAPLAMSESGGAVVELPHTNEAIDKSWNQLQVPLVRRLFWQWHANYLEAEVKRLNAVDSSSIPRFLQQWAGQHVAPPFAERKGATYSRYLIALLQDICASQGKLASVHIVDTPKLTLDAFQGGDERACFKQLSPYATVTTFEPAGVQELMGRDREACKDCSRLHICGPACVHALAVIQQALLNNSLGANPTVEDLATLLRSAIRNEQTLLSVI